MLREQLGRRRLRFTDSQRRRLAAKGKLIGRKALRNVGSIEKPDVTGFAELYVGGQLVRRHELFKIQDSFTPQRSAIGFSNVEPASARLRVILIDADLMNNDPIGIVELSYSDFAEAYRARKVLYVQVAEQSNRQVLFVAISVM